ncbi:MAG: LON peptidase substrate-binding domain-containing protein, partial [Moraxella sp.]|nr:LON peptidase substrate-binding domain-containing protein [Moraxella sp.]
MTDEALNFSTEPTSLPLLAVRDVVVYPHMQIALFVGREQSIHAIKTAQEYFGEKILVVSQKDSLSEDIDTDNLYEYGTVCRIISTMPHDNDDGCLKVLIEGMYRAKIDDIDEALVATFHEAPITNPLSDDEHEAHRAVLLEFFSDYAETSLRNAREIVKVASRIDNLLELIYFIATRASMKLEAKQSILEDDDMMAYYAALTEFFTNNKAERALENELQDTVRKQMENNQREYFLNEKMKAIKSELSDLNDGADDDDGELEKRLNEADLPDDVRKKAESEFKKLKQMPSSSSEAAVVRGYVEWILDTPWKKAS